MDEKVREIEKWLNWYSDDVRDDIKYLLSILSEKDTELSKINLALEEGTFRLQDWVNKCRVAEARVKELEKDRHRIAGEISRLREEKHDACKRVIELEEKLKVLTYDCP